MVRTQIYLTEEERAGLARIARNRGKKQSEVIREAIDSFLAQQAEFDRRSTLERLAGLWRSRSDLPDFTNLREGWDRSQTE